MPRETREFRFKIDCFTPETIPMARLAEYMADLADLLGTTKSVHFVRLEGGSTTLVQNVEYEAIPKVQQRIRGVLTKESPQDAISAYEHLDDMLEKDNAIGELIEWGDAPAPRVLNFPGRTRPKPMVYGPMTQEGSLDGVLIAVGGKNDPVPLHLEYGDIIHNCLAGRSLAMNIAANLFGPTLRVFGSGRWKRQESGRWEMLRFTVSDFQVLDQESLSEAVLDLQKIGGPLADLEDPLGALVDLRGSDEKTN